jgi:type I restriction enzyme, S subunit
MRSERIWGIWVLTSERKLLFENFFEDTPSHWKLMPFEEVVWFQEGPGILAKDFVDWRGTPLLRLTNISTSPANIDKCYFLDPELVKEKWNHFKLDLGDLLIGTSATLGSVSIVDETTVGSIPYTGIIRMRPKSEILTAGYLRCFLLAREFYLQAEASATGSVIRHYGPSHLRKMTIAIPPLEEQYVLSENFDSLSLMMVSNEHTSDKTSSIIQALFRSWFIDFSPVKAKTEGRLPYGMNEETAALFPDSFEDSDLGQIPTGWRILTLDEILDTIIDHRGLTPKKLGGDWAEEGYPAISAMNIKNGKIVKKQNIEYISEELYHKWMKVELKSGDILLTSEAPLGEIYYLFHEEKMVTSQRVFGIRSNPKLMPSIFLRYYLDSHFGQYELHARASGSTVSGIRQSELRKIKIIAPPLELMNYFSNKTKHLIENQYNCYNQIMSLEQTRDELLPRLMSGELKVN